MFIFNGLTDGHTTSRGPQPGCVFSCNARSPSNNFYSQTFHAVSRGGARLGREPNELDERVITALGTQLTDTGCEVNSTGIAAGVTAGTASQYHLINSPGVPGQILICTLVIYILKRLVVGRSPYFPMMSRRPPALGNMSVQVYNTFILPLMSSACCAVQLLVNAVFASVGCVGFNKVLGPVRPFFLAWLLHTTFSVVQREMSLLSGVHVLGPRPIGTIMLRIAAFISFTWGMALLPEFIHWRNNRVARRYASDALQGASKRTINGEHSHGPGLFEVNISVPSMGCVACIQKVSSSLRKEAGEGGELSLSNLDFTVEDASSWLLPESGNKAKRGGQARVIISTKSSTITNDMTTMAAQRLCDAMADAGFQDCHVQSITPLLQPNNAT
jgi:hypothetical protein